MTIITAKVIAHSTHAHADGDLFTLEWEYPRWIHAEGRTHRRLRIGENEVMGVDGEEGLLTWHEDARTPSPMEDHNLSRNAASSRAIPVEKLIRAVIDHPAVPVYWGANQAGMQAAVELDEHQRAHARNEWFNALGSAVMHARNLAALGCHKQIVNRVLEPFSHIKVVVTGTRWSNFLALRMHKDAEPHIRMLAEATWKAMQASTPRVLDVGDWHLPYVDGEGGYPTVTGDERGEHWEPCEDPDGKLFAAFMVDMRKLSVARCASVSYKTVDGMDMTLDRAIALHDKLIASTPLHASPAEHQASPQPQRLVKGRKSFDGELGGNLGPRWVQYRKLLPNEEVLSMPS